MKKNENSLIDGIRAKWQTRLDARWEERLHPRAKNGQFSSKGGEGSGASVQKKEKPSNSVKEPKSSYSGNTRLSNTTKTKVGVPYPKLREGAKYTSALDIAEHTAREDEKKGWIPRGTWDDVVSKLTPDDVVYQKNEDGDIVASIPGLAAMVDRRVRKGSGTMQQVFSRAKENGAQITKDMVSVAQQSGMYMDGLENSVKGASHIIDKSKRSLQKFRNRYYGDATPEDNALNFSDANRYTAVTGNDNIVDGTKKLISGLEKEGYEVTEIDNKFLGKDGKADDDATYRAVHLTVKNPKGVSFELQIHSKESLAVKDLNHVEYEKERDLDKIPVDQRGEEWNKQKNDLIAPQIERWKKYYKNPNGIETLSSYDKRAKEKPRARKYFQDYYKKH